MFSNSAFLPITLLCDCEKRLQSLLFICTHYQSQIQSNPYEAAILGQMGGDLLVWVGVLSNFFSIELTS